MKKERIFRYSLCLMLCLVLLFSVAPLPSRAVDDAWITNAAKELRKAMVNRQGEINFTYESDTWIFSPEAMDNETVLQQEVNSLLDKLYQQAIAHTGVGNEGDYLRWHLDSCEERFSYGYIQEGSQKKNFVYNFKFTLTYYTTKAQEDAVTAKVQSVRSQLNLAGKTDYEKIKAIYDYLCSNVVYDNANLNNESYDLKYSAYAALVNGTSVCQGYSNLFYRLALEEGIDCRFIFGQSRGENHSWNIVKLGGVYYNLDATWDATTGDHRYFLKTDAHMEDHTKGAEYTQSAFLTAYPMAASDYALPGNTTPVTPPPVTPPPQEDPQPETTPTTPVTPPTDEQETEPATQPETQPQTPPETEPATQPSTEGSSPPPTASQPSQDPTTVTTTTGSSVTVTTGKPDIQSSDTASEGLTTETWLLAAGGVILVAAVAGVVTALLKKRK